MTTLTLKDVRTAVQVCEIVAARIHRGDLIAMIDPAFSDLTQDEINAALAPLQEVR